jgi:hypothetical protein
MEDLTTINCDCQSTNCYYVVKSQKDLDRRATLDASIVNLRSSGFMTEMCDGIC